MLLCMGGQYDQILYHDMFLFHSNDIYHDIAVFSFK